MQNNVVNQSFFAPPTCPHPKKFIMENLLVSEKDNFCLSSWAVAVSSYLQWMYLKLIWTVIWFSFQRDGKIPSDFLHLFTQGESCKFLPDS